MPQVVQTRAQCKTCLSKFGAFRTFYQGADGRCADGCCENDYPCSGARTKGAECSGTAYRDAAECDQLIFPEDLPRLGKRRDGCKACIKQFGKGKTFYLNADSRCEHGCCPNSYPCSGARAKGGHCGPTAFEHASECNGLIFDAFLSSFSQNIRYTLATLLRH